MIASGVVQVDADARGEFRGNFPEGVYDLVISARGELSLTLRGIGILAAHTQRITRAFIPGEDDGSDGVPASAIGGYLTDRLGHPVIDAAVTATAVPESGKLMTGPSRTYTAQSDKVGAYIIHAIKPGDYDVVVRSTTRIVSHERMTIPAERLFKRYDLRLTIL